MISCDHCGKKLEEPLDKLNKLTYQVVCRDISPKYLIASNLGSTMQLCENCVDILRQSIRVIISEFLENDTKGTIK